MFGPLEWKVLLGVLKSSFFLESNFPASENYYDSAQVLNKLLRRVKSSSTFVAIQIVDSIGSALLTVKKEFIFIFIGQFPLAAGSKTKE
jgi:hypothetical protein